MLFAFLLALADVQNAPDRTTVVSGVEIVADPMDYRLRVFLTGADDAEAMVLSADPAMFCGDARFDRTPGPSRQCWLRGRRGAPIVLAARHPGAFGRDWSVDWSGCEPMEGGQACSVDIAGEMEVRARFRSL